MNYTADFKLTVAKACENAKTYTEIARFYDVSVSNVKDWAAAYKQYGDYAFIPNGPELFLKEKVSRLEKEKKDLEEENEILKKAAAFFSKRNL